MYNKKIKGKKSMYKIALCDDLKSENVKLEEFINEYKLNNPTYDISITTFTSGYDVIDYIEKYGDLPEFNEYRVHHMMNGLVGLCPKDFHSLPHYGYFYRLRN